MSESVSTKRIIDEINSLSMAYCYKIHGNRYSKTGSPDVLGSFDGFSFVKEDKVKGNKPTKIQYYELEQWRRSGAIIVPCNIGWEETIAWLVRESNVRKRQYECR